MPEGRAVKWESDQKLGVVGWVAPKPPGKTEQPRMPETHIDIDEAFDDPTVAGVLDRWWNVRQYFPDGAPPYSGGLLDAWPSIDVDGFAICYGEEQVIDDFVRFRKEPSHG